MRLLYVTTLFLSAGLLFLVQPMFAKMVLPLLGGTPAVWNTCMVFFQAALLAGYAYAHVSTTLLGVRKQAAVHALVLLAPLLALPLAVPEGWTPPTTHDPVGWLLLLLAAAIGLPFFVVASTAPLLQKWFSTTGHHAAHDPYFLYAASNLGSMLALLAYPVLVEPTLGLATQSVVWSVGYLALIALIWACAAVLWKSSRGSRADRDTSAPLAGEVTAPLVPLRSPPPEPRERDVTWLRRLRWIALAAAPSSMMLAVTTYITTDIAVVPLLWVIPLALYLLTFIFVFARRKVLPHRWMLRLLPIAAVVLLLVLLSEATQPVALVVCLHLAVFFIAAMACHGELSADRPVTRHLTEFYLLMGVGGTVGGMFNVLFAPIAFTSIAEYPIALVAACLLAPSVMGRPGKAGASSPSIVERVAARARRVVEAIAPGAVARSWARLADLAWPLALFAFTWAMVEWSNTHATGYSKARLVFTVGVPALVCFTFSGRPLRFGLAVAAVFLAGSFDTVTRGRVMEAHRSFYGVHRVTRQSRVSRLDPPTIQLHALYHGTTLHGKQYLDEQGRPAHPDQPLIYYHRDGPIGQVFSAFRDDDAARLRRVGIVGLGVGGLLAYGEAGDAYSVFEIDPVVEQIATNPAFFTFHRSAGHRGVDVKIVLGDARLTLQDVNHDAFDLLVLDAFSSDSIPIHVLTVEAATMYLEKLRPRGVLAFHISNRYLDLEPVMASLAESLDLVCLIQHDNLMTSTEQRAEGRADSVWAVMARSQEDLTPLTSSPFGRRWQPAKPEPGFRVWSDDFSNILSVFDW